MLLFARVDVLGVAWLRIVSAALISPCGADRGARSAPLDGPAAVAWGVALAAMNSASTTAIDRLPLGTVAAIGSCP